MALTTDEKNLLLLCIIKQLPLIVADLTDEEKQQGVSRYDVQIAVRTFSDERVRAILHTFKTAKLLFLNDSKAALESNSTAAVVSTAERLAEVDAEIAKYEAFVIQ
jgi:hypothetical protein